MEKLVNNTISAGLPAKVVVNRKAKVEYKMLILDSNVFISDSKIYHLSNSQLLDQIMYLEEHT